MNDNSLFGVGVGYGVLGPTDLWNKFEDCDPPPLCGSSRTVVPARSVTGPTALWFDRSAAAFTCPSGNDFDDLISDAWDVLRANADIVQFIGCVLHGGLDNLGACLERILNPSWMPGGGLVGVTRTVVVEPVSSLGNLLQVNYDLDPQRCTIFVKEKIHCDNYIDRLADPTTSPQDRECMTVDFAALLVHELVHCCGPEIMFADTTRGQPMPGQRFPPAGAEVSTCSASYMMENAFRFFMKRRYPELGTGTDCTSVGMSCCQDWDSPCILFLDTFHRWNAPVLVPPC